MFNPINAPNIHFFACPECGHLMIKEWRNHRPLQDGNYEVSDLYHCEHCDYDMELVRIYSPKGNELRQYTQQFFFG
jgi:predicted RNA-binding Zn-ribbon protein involved in translation (DUF1610 family)